MFDANSENNQVSLLPPAARTATANGTSVDLKDYIGRAKVILHSALGTGTTPTLDVKLQESDDNSTFTDISGAAFTQVTDAAASLQALSLDLDKTKRYVRAVSTIGGTTPSFTGNCVLVGRKQVAS